MISTRGRYALRVMIDIAEHNTGEYITLKEIADRQEISEKYLENILPALTKAGFLDGLRGKGGGYKLACMPESCAVGSILKLVEGNFVPVSCMEDKPNKCRRAYECRTLPMWQQFQAVVDKFFGSITIADLCNQKTYENNYVI
ncbi:MAG: Rrf2 family transcriptional regulator [Treponema sp.]|nr:Rrf2 family transcriptional regulator [Treponema sp.]